MNFDEFTGEVQHRLELPGTGETVRAIRATLSTLGQRVQRGDAEDLASSLPMEIGWYLHGPVAEHGERFDWREFLTRVSDAEDVSRSDAAYHAQVIVDLVSTVASETDFRQLRESLPEDDEEWARLFAVVDSGGWSGDENHPAGGDHVR